MITHIWGQKMVNVKTLFACTLVIQKVLSTFQKVLVVKRQQILLYIGSYHALMYH